MEERLICMRLSNTALLELVAKLAAPSIEQAGCVLWDVEFVKEAGERYLRVYIDNDEGVSIDQCELVSRALDKALDEADPIEQSYNLQISSAGVERELVRDFHFTSFMNADVTVKFRQAVNGVKLHKGVLRGYDDGKLTFEFPGEEELYVCDRKDVSSVKLDDFDPDF